MALSYCPRTCVSWILQIFQIAEDLVELVAVEQPPHLSPVCPAVPTRCSVAECTWVACSDCRGAEYLHTSKCSTHVIMQLEITVLCSQTANELKPIAHLREQDTWCYAAEDN